MSDRLKYVQYGSGFSGCPTWRNFDASPTLRFERIPVVGRLYTRNARRFDDCVEYGDIVKGLPVPAASCEAVYCSHVLEHLALDDFRTALRNTFLLLQPQGIFRLVVPDLEHCARTYLADETPDASIKFMRETYLGHERRARGLSGLLRSWLGNSQHLWMWDYRSLAEELKQAGFAGIRRATFGDSSQRKFCEVEDPGRWQDALGMECHRPR